MTRYDKAYFKKIGALLDQIIENESDLMEETANLFSEVIQQNGRIFVSGSGHSSLVAQEAYYRAGGLVSIKPIWLKSLLITENAEMSTHLERISGIARQKLGKELNLIDNKKFEFCWITDYPMYQYDEKEKKIDFSHNPFSMPQVSLKDFDKADPLSILAYQYDLVCNGYEISSGAIRNHLPNLMYKVFSKVGYSKEVVNKKFEGMIKALSYGAPPHGGMAPGIDRIVMLLAGKNNIREVTLFPMNQNAQDLLMGAPSTLSEFQLKELNIKVLEKKK